MAMLVCRQLCRNDRNVWSDFAANLRELERLVKAETPILDHREEQHATNILRVLLVEQRNNIKATIKVWRDWAAWRQQHVVSESDVELEIASGVAQWIGHDKQGRKCCVVIGRNHSPSRRKIKSFRQFLVYIVEKGCLFNILVSSADDADMSHEPYEVCVLYDRRGLVNANTDPDLVQCCQEIISDLRRWYGQRLRVVYILHVNWVFWILYHLLWPLLVLTKINKRLVIVNKPDGKCATNSFFTFR